MFKKLLYFYLSICIGPLEIYLMSHSLAFFYIHSMSGIISPNGCNYQNIPPPHIYVLTERYSNIILMLEKFGWLLKLEKSHLVNAQVLQFLRTKNSGSYSFSARGQDSYHPQEDSGSPERYSASGSGMPASPGYHDFDHSHGQLGPVESWALSNQIFGSVMVQCHALLATQWLVVQSAASERGYSKTNGLQG